MTSESFGVFTNVPTLEIMGAVWATVGGENVLELRMQRTSCLDRVEQCFMFLSDVLVPKLLKVKAHEILKDYD